MSAGVSQTPDAEPAGQLSLSTAPVSTDGAADADPARPRLPPLHIPAYLRQEAVPQSARTPRARIDQTPITPSSRYSPASPSAATAAASANRRRAHSVGISLRPRSTSRSGGIQGLTSNFGLPATEPASSGRVPGAAANGEDRLGSTIDESYGEDGSRRARPGQGTGIPEEAEDDVTASHQRGRNVDVLAMAELGAAIDGPATASRTAHATDHASDPVADIPTTGADGNGNTGAAKPRSRGRTRGSSIVDRIRNSIESRERRDSRDVEGEPVGYEVVNKRRGSGKGAGEAEGAMVGEEREDLDDGVVGMLDVMDAEVSTVNHLQNVTNSIFLPHFPALWSRRPEIVIEHDPHVDAHQRLPRGADKTVQPSASTRPLLNTAFEAAPPDANAPQPASPSQLGAQGAGRTRKTRSSTVAGLYAPSPVTPTSGPEGGRVKGQRPTLPRILSQPSPYPDYDSEGAGGADVWTSRTLRTPKAARGGRSAEISAIPEAEAYGDDSTHAASASPTVPNTDAQPAVHQSAPSHPTSSSDTATDLKDTDSVHSLDLHVRQVLHASKRERIKKGLKGLWVFLKTPMGFVVGIYGVLVVFWGAALVIILAGWIPMPNKWWQDRWVEICSQIVNGLFTITGVGLIPWRVQDTYRMIIISSLKRRTHIKRRRAGLAPIEDPNDIPDPKEQEDYVSVLTEKEQARLTYQQEKFAQSQTWYRPHATATHTAFPITWALWNTVLMDLNSVFQCMLCGCMWGLNQYQRPAWTTGSLIPLSFLCGIGAGVLIWQGSARTKKRETVEDKLRMALGVPLAIALPQTKDGTFITGDNKALIGKSKGIRRKSRRRSSQSTSSAGGDALPLNAMGGRYTKGADAEGEGGETDSEGGDKDTSRTRLNVLDVPRDKEVTEKAKGPERMAGKEDGTVPLAKMVSPSMDRRATVTLGNVPDDMASDGQGKRERERGQTIGGVEELKR